jgi:prolyl-tRNA synthetase
MKDAYSFDKEKSGLDKNYKLMYEAYQRIFKRCGLDFLITEADPGLMGGNISHEFMVPADSGEDILWHCQKCLITEPFKEGIDQNKKTCSNCKAELAKISAIEVGHIFQLGTKYSEVLGARFLSREGKLEPIVMGCYGIGVSRIIAAIIEQRHDTNGITWPLEISPYKVLITPLDVKDKKIMDTALGVYNKLCQGKTEVLLDDRDEQAGVKFKDADLLGVYLQVIIGRELLKKNSVELRTRRDKKSIVIKKADAIKKIEKIIYG